MLLVSDGEHILLLSGSRDVFEPDDDVAAIGSGGPYAPFRSPRPAAPQQPACPGTGPGIHEDRFGDARLHQRPFRGRDPVGGTAWRCAPAAKIDLGLEITGVLSNGYHTLDSVFYPLARPFDSLLVERRKGAGIRVYCDTPGIDAEHNT